MWFHTSYFYCGPPWTTEEGVTICERAVSGSLRIQADSIKLISHRSHFFNSHHWKSFHLIGRHHLNQSLACVSCPLDWCPSPLFCPFSPSTTEEHHHHRCCQTEEVVFDDLLLLHHLLPLWAGLKGDWFLFRFQHHWNIVNYFHFLY